MLAGTAASIDLKSNLLDDFFQTEDASVPAELRNRFVIVQDLASNETASEIVTVNSDGEVVHFRPDPQSESGWSKTTHRVAPPSGATSSDIQELVAFYQDGQLNVVVYFAAAVGSIPHWVQWDETTGWSNAPVHAEALDAMRGTRQATLYRDPSGDCYLYGWSTSAQGEDRSFVIAWIGAAMQWKWISLIPLRLYPEGRYEPFIRMAPGSDGEQFRYQWISNGVLYTDSAYLDNDTLFFGDPDNKHFVPLEPTRADMGFVSQWEIANIVPLPATYAKDNLLLRLANGTIYLIQGITQSTIVGTMLLGNIPDTNPLGGPDAASVASAGYYVDDSGADVLMLFAVDEDQSNLWYLSQDLSTLPKAPQFGDWVNLGATLNWVVCPGTMIHGPEMFTVTTDEKIKHLARTPSQPGTEGETQVWVSQRLAQPVPSSAEPDRVAAYVMELGVTDAGGSGVQSLVHATADHRATIVVDGLSYGLTPTTPMSFTTDAGGRATIRLRATDLTPPQITFRVSNGVERWVRGDVVEVKPGETDPGQPVESVANRFQNKDPSRPVNNEALAQPIDEDREQIEPLMSENFNPAQDGDAASAIIASGGWIDPNNVNPDGTIKVDQLPVEHWELHFPPDGPPVYRELTAEEGMALVRTARSAPAVQGLGKIFGDVVHYFKHAWNELSHFAATIERDAEGLAKSLTIVFNKATSFVIKTVKEAGAALETIFTRIAELAEEAYHVIQNVIKWLKMLFKWDDILHTKNILKACVVSTLKNVRGSVEWAKEDADIWFAKFKSEVRAALQALIDNPTFNDTFNGFVNGIDASGRPALAASSGNRLANPPNHALFQQYNSKCNYVQSRASKAAGTSSGGQLLAAFANASPEVARSVSTISDAFQRDIVSNPQYQSGISELENYIKNAVSNPKMFFSQIIRALVSAGMDVADFVIGALDNVVDAILDLVEAAITGLIGVDGKGGTLNHELHVPVISWMYEHWLKAGKLTLLDVACLGVALPGTLLFKLMNNNRPPFEGITAEEIENGLLPWPSKGDSTEQSTAPTVRADTLQVMGEVAATLQFMNAGCAFLTDLWAAEPEPEPPNTDPDRTFISMCSMVTSFSVQCLTTPAEQINKSDPSAADNATLRWWSLGYLPLVVDAIYMYAEKQQTKLQSPILDGILHLVCATSGWVAGVRQIDDPDYSDWDVANSFIGLLMGSFGWAIRTGEWAPPLVAGADVVIGIGSGLTILESTS